MKPDRPRAHRRHRRWRMVQRALRLMRMWDAPKGTVLDARGLSVYRRPHAPERCVAPLAKCSCFDSTRFVYPAVVVPLILAEASKRSRDVQTLLKLDLSRRPTRRHPQGEGAADDRPATRGCGLKRASCRRSVQQLSSARRCAADCRPRLAANHRRGPGGRGVLP